jgi:hypothetical protein
MMVDDKVRVQIIVNGRKKVVTSEELTFGEVVLLAYDPVPSGPYIEITVTYRKGGGRPPEGRLFPDKEVKIQNGTIFNVTVTDKS